ncbi:MAG: histidinol-phosphate transaminase [Gammaproteobacteria bacterium]|nr:MAG: histidinol-phosphate transaminase [Gammaproteobacteria bacterium]
MSRFWSPIVKELTPYVPGEQPRHADLLKLNTNENPYGPSPEVAQAINAAVANLQLYPEPESIALREALAGLYAGVTKDEVFVGNGSDEVLALVFHALLQREKPVYGVDVSYSFYPVWAKLYGVDWQTIPLCDDFSVDIDAFPDNSGGIVLPNPNAPTGVLLGLDAIETLLKKHRDCLLVIDEAYIDFGGESAVPLIKNYDNLLVVQTFSKSRSLAGLRVGMAFGHQDLVDALIRVKNSFNSYPLDRLTQAGAVAALEDKSWFDKTRTAVIDAREKLTEALSSMGFAVLPSHANFVLASHPDYAASELFAKLREQGVIVRYWNAGRISNHLRITVGTPAQCERLVAALRQLLV